MAARVALPWFFLASMFVSDLQGRGPFTAVAAATATATDEWCLERGFDPSNLSCDTCVLLDESPSLQRRRPKSGQPEFDPPAECRSCCRSHRSNPVLRPSSASMWQRGKYRYAVLAHGGVERLKSSYEEISDFIDRDADDVRSFKGDHRFTISDSSEREGGSSDGSFGGGARMVMTDSGMQIVGGNGFGGAPKLLLFEKRKAGGGLWSEEDEDEAGDVIALRGWKREDLKDMLMTLLPNA